MKRSSSKLKIVFVTIGFAVTIAIFLFILKNFDIQKTISLLSNVPVYFVISMVAVYLITFPLRALRWKSLLATEENSNFVFIISSILIGFAGNNFIPARGGEVLRMEFFSRGTKCSRATAMTSIFLEKVFDAFLLFLIFNILSFWVPDSDSIFKNLRIILIVLFFCLGITISIFLLFQRKILLVLEKKHSKPAIFLSALIFKISASFTFLKTKRKIFEILGLSLIIWLLEGIVFVLGVAALVVSGNWIMMGFFALCIVNFSILLPSSPGYIGVFQAAVIIALSVFGLNSELSLSIAILVHAVQFLPVTLLGGYIFIKYYYQKIKQNST